MQGWGTDRPGEAVFGGRFARVGIGVLVAGGEVSHVTAVFLKNFVRAVSLIPKIAHLTLNSRIWPSTKRGITRR